MFFIGFLFIGVPLICVCVVICVCNNKISKRPNESDINPNEDTSRGLNI